MILTQFCSSGPHVLRFLSCRIQPSNSFFISHRRSKDHYEALGVSRNATQADIKAAYYKLSMLYHPDRNETPEAAQSFRNITEAYEVVGNFKLRKMYDKGLLGHVADDGSQRTYTNYNPSSSYYKNKPTHHSRSSAYNFDKWTQFHYGDAVKKRHAAKMKHEYKTDPGGEKEEARNENAAYVMLMVTMLCFAILRTIDRSLDNPGNSVSSKKQ